MCQSCDELMRAKLPIIDRAACMRSIQHRITPSEVDELKSAAYARVLEAKTRDTDLISKPNSYFHALVRNLSIDMIRTRASFKTESIETVRENHSNLIEECISENSERRASIVYLFERLDPDQRKVLWSILEGFTIRECAEWWEVTETNAKQIRYRALKASREIMSDFASETGPVG